MEGCGNQFVVRRWDNQADTTFSCFAGPDCPLAAGGKEFFVDCLGLTPVGDSCAHITGREGIRKGIRGWVRQRDYRSVVGVPDLQVGQVDVENLLTGSRLAGNQTQHESP